MTASRWPLSVSLVALLLAGAVPVEAQAARGWSPGFEVQAGFVVPTRDLGKILGSEVGARIRTELKTSPMFLGGVRLRTPAAGVSVRGLVGYTSTAAHGRPAECLVVSGPGCAGADVDATILTFVGDVVFHSRRVEGPSLRYFFAGVGVRRYAFQETGCPVTEKACHVMEEFLTDQTAPLFRLGLGYRKQLRGFAWSVEFMDLVGPFDGQGAQAEGGLQNDLVLSVGLSFPGS